MFRRLRQTIIYVLLKREYKQFCDVHKCSTCYMDEKGNRCIFALLIAYLEKELKV